MLIELTCQRCGKLFKVYPSHARRKYCSEQCWHAPTALERFWAMVHKTSEGCWIWTGSKNQYGYGQFWYKLHRPQGAHRISYELVHGPIPDRICVLHRCDNPACVNPAHLFLGTPKDNTADCQTKGRHSPPPRAPKLTEDDVRAIRVSSESQVALAAKYNVDPSTISNVLTRHSWLLVS